MGSPALVQAALVLGSFSACQQAFLVWACEAQDAAGPGSSSAVANASLAQAWAACSARAGEVAACVRHHVMAAMLAACYYAASASTLHVPLTY